MFRKLAAVAALAVATVSVASIASIAAAGPVTAKQRVSIQVTGRTNKPFILTPLSSGAIEADSGTVSFCCWTSRHVTRNGLGADLANPQMTLTGKRGTLVVRNHIEWVDLPSGWAIFTGTWKVVRGTGAYAGVSGGGSGGGVTFANNDEKTQFEGFLTK